jgi:hypothetical protein
MRLQNDPLEVVRGNHKRPTFLLGFITLGMVPIEWCVTMMRLQCPINCNMESLLVKGMEVGVARNYLAEYATRMRPRPEFLLTIGDDMLASWNSLLILYEEMRKGEFDVLSGLYYMKADQYAPPMPVMSRDDIDGYVLPNVHYIPGEIIEVQLTGMDFTIIRTDMFDNLGPPPWFKSADSSNIENKETKGLTIFTEDAFFCQKVKEKGYKMGVHTGVRIGHLNVKSGEVY